jgi:hypothetical protein
MSQLCHLAKHQTNTPLAILERFQAPLMTSENSFHGILESQHPMYRPPWTFQSAENPSQEHLSHYHLFVWRRPELRWACRLGTLKVLGSLPLTMEHSSLQVQGTGCQMNLNV